MPRITYDGLVLTSIDVVSKATTEHPNRVTFNGGIEGKAEDTTATFLINVRQVNYSGIPGRRDFEADTVTVEEAIATINEAASDGDGKPLFCIHGFGVEPGDHLRECGKHAQKFDKGKNYLVPVIWPNSMAYNKNMNTVVGGVANALALIKEKVDVFPGKSLMAHSLGNYIVSIMANSKLQFDNIFMVAPDVRYDIFHKKVIESGKKGAENGLNIFRSLSENSDGTKRGKVYVFANRSDRVLQLSSWKHWRTRLGQVGSGQGRTIWGFRSKPRLTHPEIRGSVETIIVTSKLKKAAEHGYQFDDFAIKLYQEKCDEVMDRNADGFVENIPL